MSLSLLKLLYEVFDSQYDLQHRQNQKPTSGEPFLEKRIFTFHPENHKIILEVYRYPNNFYFVAFYPKLNRDVKKNKYRIQLNFKQPTKVLSTVFNYLQTILKDDPLASFGFYGAPDLEDKETNYTTYMSKRYRIYLQMIDMFKFKTTHNIITDPNMSAIMMVNKEKLKETPEITKYMADEMDQAIM